MPDPKVAEILQFIINYIDIVLRGPNIPQLPKKELSQVLEYMFPHSQSDVRHRPGKGFKAVMRGLLRCMGCNESVMQQFGNNQRFWKYVGWNDEGRNKVSESLAWRAGSIQNPHMQQEDGDDDDEEKKMHLGGLGKLTGTGALVHQVKQSRVAGRASKVSFTPKYDVLFSRTTWSYYLRIFLPMCDAASIQQGIKLDLLRGQLSMKGRYQPTATLPPWCTQNEALSDLDVVQPLPPSACGDFTMDIPLPFDVDRSARKEVHVADIGIIVSMKRLKEEIPQMEFKVHTFSQGSPAPGMPLGPQPSGRAPGVPGASRVPASQPMLLHPHGVVPVPMNY